MDCCNCLSNTFSFASLFCVNILLIICEGNPKTPNQTKNCHTNVLSKWIPHLKTIVIWGRTGPTFWILFVLVFVSCFIMLPGTVHFILCMFFHLIIHDTSCLYWVVLSSNKWCVAHSVWIFLCDCNYFINITLFIQLVPM